MSKDKIINISIHRKNRFKESQSAKKYKTILHSDNGRNNFEFFSKNPKRKFLDIQTNSKLNSIKLSRKSSLPWVDIGNQTDFQNNSKPTKPLESIHLVNSFLKFLRLKKGCEISNNICHNRERPTIQTMKFVKGMDKIPYFSAKKNFMKKNISPLSEKNHSKRTIAIHYKNNTRISLLTNSIIAKTIATTKLIDPVIRIKRNNHKPDTKIINGNMKLKFQ